MSEDETMGETYIDGGGNIPVRANKQARSDEVTAYDLERVLRVVRQKRAELKAAGVDEYDVNLQPLICSMLEALLQHEADKER